MDGKSCRILPVILSGGSGTRLWPASRDSLPKQFLALIGESSTFQATVQRVMDQETFLRPVVISGKSTRFVVSSQLAQIGVAADIILEPVQRDTAAAIAVAACHAAHLHPETIVLVAAADHVIGDAADFVAACRAAIEPARQGYIMTLGIVPRQPATCYGYIKPGKLVEGTQACRVERFVEKPDAETAQDYISQGFVWNSGSFLFRADVMIEELERLQPDILSHAREALDRAVADPGFIRLDEGAFRKAPKASIDYAVMERTGRAGVLPVSFPWSDIGSWDALWEALPRDEAGNALRGDVEVVEARNSLIHSEGRLTAVVGLDDVIVVAGPDAVLVASRNRVEMMKSLVASMRERRRPEIAEHLRVYHSWGWRQRVGRGDLFDVTHITVRPGGGFSLRHPSKSEHWVVLSGTAEVFANGEARLFRENEVIHIPIDAAHRLSNRGPAPLEMIKIQTGSRMDEGGISRFEDPSA